MPGRGLGWVRDFADGPASQSTGTGGRGGSESTLDGGGWRHGMGGAGGYARAIGQSAATPYISAVSRELGSGGDAFHPYPTPHSHLAVPTQPGPRGTEREVRGVQEGGAGRAADPLPHPHPVQSTTQWGAPTPPRRYDAERDGSGCSIPGMGVHLGERRGNTDTDPPSREWETYINASQPHTSPLELATPFVGGPAAFGDLKSSLPHSSPPPHHFPPLAIPAPIRHVTAEGRRSANHWGLEAVGGGPLKD